MQSRVSEESAISGSTTVTATSFVHELAAKASSNLGHNQFAEIAFDTFVELTQGTVSVQIELADAFGNGRIKNLSGDSVQSRGSIVWLPSWITDSLGDSAFVVSGSKADELAYVLGASRSAHALVVPIKGSLGTTDLLISVDQNPEVSEDQLLQNSDAIAGLISLSASREAAFSGIETRELREIAAKRISQVGTTANLPISDRLSRVARELSRFIDFDSVGLFINKNGKYDPIATYGDDSLTGGIGETALQELEPGRASSAELALSNTCLIIPFASLDSEFMVLSSPAGSNFNEADESLADFFSTTLATVFNQGSLAVHPPIQDTPVKTEEPYRLEVSNSITGATDLTTACGALATQITKRTTAIRVRIGFIDEDVWRGRIYFDTSPERSPEDADWITPDETEHREESGDADSFTSIRIPLKSKEKLVGYVEALADDSSPISEVQLSTIEQVVSTCSTTIWNLRQLEESRWNLNKLEQANRICEQIRNGRSANPIRDAHIATLLRNLFEADWIYFGQIDHDNDRSTTLITEGIDVPELAIGSVVSRRSLLVPSTLSVWSPVTVDIESAAPGQRAAARWMYRAGLRSAVCAPLRSNGVVTTMLMCASALPSKFGAFEKKMATRVVSELEAKLQRSTLSKPGNSKTAPFTLVDQLGAEIHSVLGTVPSLIINVDKDGVVTEAAGRGIEGLNLTPERLRGRDFIAYARRISGLGESIQRALEGQSNRLEVGIFGTVLDAWMEPNPSTSNGNSATIVVSDITDRVVASRYENELKILRDEKDRTAKFIASLSHEMKSPLTSVVALTDVLAADTRGNLHPDQMERISVVQQNAERLTSLVNDFLKVSKMQAGSYEVHKSKFAIAELANDLRNSFAPITESRTQQLTVTAPDDQQFVFADRELLRQSMANLLSNASKYSPENTNVTLDIWLDSDDLRITVSDEGSGIPTDQRDAVFEPYSQLDHPDIPGTGMGLAIVRQIIELHEGRVWVEDGLGGGSSFAIWLPRILIRD